MRTNEKWMIGLGLAALLVAAPALAANSLSVTGGAALNGTNFGLQVNVDNTATNAVYVQSDHPNNETHMRVVWRMKINELNAPASGAGRNFRFMNFVDSDDAANPHKILFLQRQATTGNWRLAVWTRNTTSNAYEFSGGLFVATNLSTNDIQLQCEWTKDTIAGAGGNGIMECKRLTGSLQQFLDNDNDDDLRQTDSVQMGFFDFDSFPGAAASGNCKMDEYESYR
jgi:hypothetical protein